MSEQKKKKHTMFLSVLGYKEDGLFVAHCLEMDLKGRGDTPEEAMRDLQDYVRMQVSFAVYKGEMELLDHRADEKYFEIFERLIRESLRTYPKITVHDDYSFDQFPLTDDVTSGNYQLSAG